MTRWIGALLACAACGSSSPAVSDAPAHAIDAPLGHDAPSAVDAVGVDAASGVDAAGDATTQLDAATDAATMASVTIQQVQNDAMPPGTPVSLQGVVVTAIDSYGAKTGDFWVEDPAGGAFSGVHVFGAPVAMVAALALGDVVTITGAQKAEFALASDTTGRTLTELEPVSGGAIAIAKTGTGAVPAPMVVDALAVGQLPTQAARDAEWEKWEGVLITVNHVSALDAPVCVGTACTDPTLQDFDVTGQLEIESSLAAFPAVGPGCLASVTGVEDYFFSYLLLPRTTAELVTGGTGCPAAEAAAGTSIGTCGDGIDNDGNGFTDCLDLGCEVGANAWLGATCGASDAMCGCSANFPTNSATAVNAAATVPATPIVMHDQFVTGVSTKGYWISDSLTAASGNSLFVFQGSAPAVTAGQKLATVQGIVKAYNPSVTTGASTILELNFATAGAATTGGAAVPLVQTAGVVGGLSSGKPFASALVQLANVKVKSIGLFDQVTLVDNTNTTITMDDDAFQYYGGTSAAPATPAVGTCFKTLTGFMDLTTSDTASTIEVRSINPRGASDMISVGGTCTGI